MNIWLFLGQAGILHEVCLECVRGMPNICQCNYFLLPTVIWFSMYRRSRGWFPFPALSDANKEIIGCLSRQFLPIDIEVV